MFVCRPVLSIEMIKLKWITILIELIMFFLDSSHKQEIEFLTEEDLIKWIGFKDTN